jgi:hypothetical protein
MTLASPTAQKRIAPHAPRITADRRRHKRFSLTLLGRFMRANRQEFPCKLTDISVGGAAMMSPIQVEVGERIVAYFDHLGGFEGTVARRFEGGFAFQFKATQHKREKLAAQITWLINRNELDPADLRRPGHERVTLVDKTSTLRLADDLTIAVKVLDISISGASIGTPARPAIGTEVQIGKLRARVMRHHSEGIGVEFLDIQNPDALRRYFGT